MCFSASASIGAGVVLTVIGIAALKKTHRGSQVFFAIIPLVFGLQQFAEGVLWITLPNQDYVTTHKIFTFVFIFIAQVFWPIWVPVSILLLEKNKTRKNIQKVLVVAGIVVGGYLFYCLCFFQVQAKIDGQHIAYFQNYPTSFKGWGIVLYIMATIVPSLLSGVTGMWFLGTTILSSYIISAFFYEHYVLSVWCFFASIISISVYLILSKIAKENKGRAVPATS